MIGFFIFSIAIFVAYIAATVLKFGVPESISESAYLWGGEKGKMLFWAFTTLTTFPLMIFWLDKCVGNAQVLLAFVACAGLALVGTASQFKSYDETAHVIGALVCAVASQVWTVLFTPYWAINVVLFTVFVPIGMKTSGVKAGKGTVKSLTFFLEMACFLGTFFMLLSNYVL